MRATSLLRTIIVSLVAGHGLAIASHGGVTVQPWCKNSMRVKVAPPSGATAWSPAGSGSSPPSCAKKEEGTDQVGGKLLKMLPNVSDENCCAQCLDMPQCSVWVTSPQKACFLVQGYTGKKAASDRTAGFVREPGPPPPGALVTDCGPGAAISLVAGGEAKSGNLRAAMDSDGKITFSRVDTGATLFSAAPSLSASSYEGYVAVDLALKAGDAQERIYGLGQGNWSAQNGGCASGHEHVVPLERNGQTVDLQQTKFHVSIPFAYSSAGYGFLFNMQGYGSVTVGQESIGGMQWRAEAALGLDFWVSALPKGEPPTAAAPIYKQYADATGHAPALRDDAMLFWQSRNRYKSSAIALSVADRYAKLGLPVGVLVIDYKNQKHDGDFAPDPKCYPSVKQLADGVRKKINATLSFSFWPEALANSAEFSSLDRAGCLMNGCLGGRAIDATAAHCREMIWTQFLKPRYVDQGVSAFWLDETDGEGTAPGPHGQYGGHGYDTSYGPAYYASNAWVNDWLKMFSEPVAALGETPMVLTRSVWAGGQRYGTVLWSSDIESTFEELGAQLNLGVHASLSGIPWWTSDVGGYGCGSSQLDNSAYMRELIVRWYQFGCFSPIFRTHGCRKDTDPEPDEPCKPRQRSCGPNEVWSYGNETQVILEKYVRLRAALKPYIAELAANVSAHGVPTVRPLWWEFPADKNTVGINDQYLLGPDLLVAPVTKQGAVNRQVYFPAGATWKNLFDDSDVVAGGTSKMVAAPLETIPVYKRTVGFGTSSALVV